MVLLSHNHAMALFRRFGWLERWASNSPTQVGVAAASWSVAGTFARGLLPRQVTQQAVATGVVAATHYELAATAWASMQALAARPGERPGTRATLTVAALGVAGGAGISALAQRASDRSLTAAGLGAVGRVTAFSALAGGAAAAWDEVLHRRLGLRPGLDTTLVPAIATGASVVGFSILNRSRRAARFGVVAPERHAVANTNGRAVAQAAAVGAASAVALGAATATEQLAAHLLERGFDRVLGRPTGALGTLAAHGLLLGGLAAAGIAGVSAVTQRVQQRDDIVEPAYPAPPTSPHVSAGPASSMPFDSLGKEGRRFVLMALTAQQIEEVMGEPAIEPVRVVGGFESAASVAERARLTLQDMVDVGAFTRSWICVGSPTGVGYFNYSVAEALEYLTRGDCAIVVPQYALVPSALALTRTEEAVELTTLVLQGIKEHLSTRAEQPTVILIGESLGANVALDLSVSADGSGDARRLAELGVSGGMYLGVPFRTKLWKHWRTAPHTADPEAMLTLVSQPDEIDRPDDGTMRHLMVVHHDDPVNKYGFAMVLQPPWWMGPPSTRPPLVPREAKFRPFTTFVLATVDLFNGMQSKPGTFVRRAHDYRIDIVTGLIRAFGFTATQQQEAAVEQALRQREQEWATRRMIARKMDRARRAIERQLQEWGSNPIDVADLDPTLASSPQGIARLSLISAPPGA
jgi:uncharacterized membrane protein